MNWYKQEGEHLFLFVYAKPASSKNEITGLNADQSRLCIKIKAPPVDGLANEELIKYLSKLLKVPKTSILLHKGESSKQKVLIFTEETDKVFSFFSQFLEK